MKRTLAVAAAVAALLSTASGAAQAAPVDDKNLCKDGGFANYVDPTTDLPFKNQGRCVSFVNAGGTLVPVEDEPPVPVAPTAVISLGSWNSYDQLYYLTVQFQGQPNTTYQITQRRSPDPDFTFPVVTNADGLAFFKTTAPYSTDYVLLYGGAVIGSLTTPDAPVQEQASIALAENPDQPLAPTFTLTDFEPNETVYIWVAYGGGSRWPWGNQTVDTEGTLTLGTPDMGHCNAVPVWVTATRADGSVVTSDKFTPAVCQP